MERYLLDSMGWMQLPQPEAPADWLKLILGRRWNGRLCGCDASGSVPMNWDGAETCEESAIQRRILSAWGIFLRKPAAQTLTLPRILGILRRFDKSGTVCEV